MLVVNCSPSWPFSCIRSLWPSSVIVVRRVAVVRFCGFSSMVVRIRCGYLKFAFFFFFAKLLAKNNPGHGTSVKIIVLIIFIVLQILARNDLPLHAIARAFYTSTAPAFASI